MALGTCFRVNTAAPSSAVAVAAPRACAVHGTHVKLYLPAVKAMARVGAFSSTSPFFLPQRRRGRAGRFVCEAKDTVAEVLDVTEATWGELVTGNDKVVVVDFWAPWCGPCRMIEPLLGELAKEYAGKVVCLKLNTDDNPRVANQFGIRSIPTVLFFKNGEKKESVIGAVPKSTLSGIIDKFVEA